MQTTVPAHCPSRVIGFQHFHIEAVPLQLGPTGPAGPETRFSTASAVEHFLLLLFLDENQCCQTELSELPELPRGDTQTILRRSAYYCLLPSSVNLLTSCGDQTHSIAPPRVLSLACRVLR
jgi:hypothetical protein